MSPSSADVVSVALGFIGVAEDPPHSNRTVIGELFGWNGVAWCAESVSVWEAQAGNSTFNGSASCSTLVGRYESGEIGTWLGNPGADGIQSGDEFFLGSRGQDHTGLVEFVDGDGKVHSIEGNWGDRVTKVVRPPSAFFGFGRPFYDGAAMPGIPPPSATQGRPVLRNGSSGQVVSDQQSWLNLFHNAGLTVDGGFGGQTQTAVENFQRDNGLTVDGVIGPDTYAKEDAITAWCAAQGGDPEPDGAPPFPGTIVLGSVGAAPTAFQQRLADRGWPCLVDGVDGKKTTATIRAYQQEKGLEVDGVGGPATWVSLWHSPIT